MRATARAMSSSRKGRWERRRKTGLGMSAENYGVEFGGVSKLIIGEGLQSRTSGPAQTARWLRGHARDPPPLRQALVAQRVDHLPSPQRSAPRRHVRAARGATVRPVIPGPPLPRDPPSGPGRPSFPPRLFYGGCLARDRAHFAAFFFRVASGTIHSPSISPPSPAHPLPAHPDSRRPTARGRRRSVRPGGSAGPRGGPTASPEPPSPCAAPPLTFVRSTTRRSPGSPGSPRRWLRRGWGAGP